MRSLLKNKKTLFNANSRRYLRPLACNPRELALENKLDSFLKQVLLEDACCRDITTRSLNYGNLKVKAVLKAKEAGTCAGMNILKPLFKLVDKNIKFKVLVKDGQDFSRGKVLARVEGKASSILTCERAALNFISRLSGIATLTRQFVKKVRPYKVRIMDTRKTTPGLRLLEKYAVRMAGGYNHRYDLAEAILIKDNHIAALKKKYGALNLCVVLKKLKKRSRVKEIEIEVNSVAEFKQTLSCPPDIIMLDNMSLPQMRECDKLRN